MKQVSKRVWDEIRNEVRVKVWSRGDSRFWIPVKAQVERQAYELVSEEVFRHVWQQVWDGVRTQSDVVAMVDNQIWNQ